MVERRFITYPELVDRKRKIIRLPEEEAHHASRVLRLKEGDEVTVIDGLHIYFGRIADSRLRSFTVVFDSEVKVERTYPEIVLCQAYAKGKKADFIVEKATEAGADKIIFFRSEHAVSYYDETKLKRLSKVAWQASKQSKRPYPPEVEGKDGFYLPEIGEDELGLVLDPEGSPVELKELACGERLIRKLYIFVGPEGGFSKREKEKFKEKGFLLVRLNLPVLRTETAALASVVLASFLFKKGF